MATTPPQLSLLVLRSPDMERAVTFYRALGLEFTLHAHGTGPQHYTAEMGALVFEIYPQTAKSSPTTGTRIGFSVASLDEAVQSLSQIDAVIMTPPTESEWGRRAVVKDFDGHTVELVESKK